MPMARQGSFDDLSSPLSQVTFVVVDVETTGGSPATSSLTEVAAARYRGGQMLGTYQTLVRPDERIPPWITALTGISDAMVTDAPRVGEMLPSLLEFVGGAVLVGHNLRFDLSFLDHALVSTGREPLPNATVDTLALARRLVRDMVPDCKLGTLASSLRLSHQPSHRALTDVLATGDLLHAMLERAGSFGILELEELLDLPRLVGHPQAAKLRLTTRLPHRTGVYWFTDAAGHVLHVGKATDLHRRVRFDFSAGQRGKIGRLLRQLHAVHYRVCPGPLTASVLEERLIGIWSPAFNRKGRRADPALATRSTTSSRTGHSARPPTRRRTWSAEELENDPADLLAPFVEQVVELSCQHRYEEAASVRDEAEGLRQLLTQHREAESLRLAGLTRLSIDGEGMVTLDGGLLVGCEAVPGERAASDSGTPPRPGPAVAEGRAAIGDCHHNERIIVAQWLKANTARVRILEVESDLGMAMPAVRIPRLAELCARQDCKRPSVSAHAETPAGHGTSAHVNTAA